MITVLAGGVGGARLLSGLVGAFAASDITVIANTGDDLELYGLSISPDLDTITYTLSGRSNTTTGWGLEGESWTVMESLESLGIDAWFRLGDKDLATHLYRTQRLAEGALLSEVTAELAKRSGLELQLLPMSNDAVRTKLQLAGGDEVDFQRYFVQLRQSPVVKGVRYDGADRSTPGPGVLEALRDAEVIVLAPSNPILSLAPILAVPGIAEALVERRQAAVAISPIVGGKALKGPADHLLTELGYESSAAGVASLLQRYVASIVIDTVDAGSAATIEALPMSVVIADTVMRDPATAQHLAKAAVDAAHATRELS